MSPIFMDYRKTNCLRCLQYKIIDRRTLLNLIVAWIDPAADRLKVELQSTDLVLLWIMRVFTCWSLKFKWILHKQPAYS
jgi:hypothetical protein